AMDLAARALDHVAIPLHHRRHLLTLVRVDQKHDFVVSQPNLPLGLASRPSGEARSKTRPVWIGGRHPNRGTRGGSSTSRLVFRPTAPLSAPCPSRSGTTSPRFPRRTDTDTGPRNPAPG